MSHEEHDDQEVIATGNPGVLTFELQLTDADTVRALMGIDDQLEPDDEELAFEADMLAKARAARQTERLVPGRTRASSVRTWHPEPHAVDPTSMLEEEPDPFAERDELRQAIAEAARGGVGSLTNRVSARLGSGRLGWQRRAFEATGGAPLQERGTAS